MEAEDFAVNVRKPRGKHPKGYEPGFEWNGRKGTICATSVEATPQFEALLAELCTAIGEDPAGYEIVGDIQVRRWQQTPGDDFLYYHRATIHKRCADGGEDAYDVDALLKDVARRKPRKLDSTTSDSGAGLVISMGDWQVGKSDGDGVRGTCARLAMLPDLIESRWRELRKVGVPLEVIYLCFGGDLKESCNGHYAQQAFRVALNNREQRRVIRTSAERIIDRAASLAPVAVKVVGGNHGEEREGGKSHTDFADNVDVAVIEDIAYAYSLNSSRYGNVTFAIPNDDLTLTFSHDGLVVGMAHGHQAGFGTGDPRTKIHAWWKGQMDGQQPIGDADVLLTYHFHHPWMIRRGARTHFGCPSLDGGSDWFRSLSGMDAPPSTLSFVVTGQGWDHMRLLG